MQVYVVVTYPDGECNIKAVFEDRDQAIYCCALCEREDATIEEWDTEAIKITGTKKPLATWSVYINSKGEVIETDLRYTFSKVLKFREDMDGSGAMYLTTDIDVPEDEVKKIALDHWQRMKK